MHYHDQLSFEIADVLWPSQGHAGLPFPCYSSESTLVIALPQLPYLLKVPFGKPFSAMFGDSHL